MTFLQMRDRVHRERPRMILAGWGDSLQFARRFPPAIHEKEKRCESDEKQGAAKHPNLIGPKRSNLLGREICQSDAQNGGDQTAGAGEKQSVFAVATWGEIVAGGNLQ